MSEAVDSTAPTRPAAVKSADRTVELLEVMSRSERQLTLTELHRELSYPKSSLYMLLQTLVSRGWVEVDPQRGSYGIGVRALLVGTSYLDHDPVVRTAIRVMEQVRQQINETVHLARLDGADVVYLASRESDTTCGWCPRRPPAARARHLAGQGAAGRAQPGRGGRAAAGEPGPADPEHRHRPRRAARSAGRVPRRGLRAEREENTRRASSYFAVALHLPQPGDRRDELLGAARPAGRRARASGHRGTARRRPDHHRGLAPVWPLSTVLNNCKRLHRGGQSVTELARAPFNTGTWVADPPSASEVGL